MLIGTPIDRVGGKGFRVTGRSAMGGNLATDKGGGQAETVLGCIEGAEQDID